MFVQIKSFTKKELSTSDFVLSDIWNVNNVDISGYMTFISDFHAVVDLTGFGETFPPNAQTIAFSWNNKLQAEIPVQTHELVLDCQVESVPVNSTEVSFNPPHKVPAQDGDNSDGEFDGHGPCMQLSVNINLDPSRKVLTATIWMDAWECPDDFGKIQQDQTEAEGTKTITLYQAKDDETIGEFDIRPSFFEQYIDTDVNSDARYYDADVLCPVRKIVFTGDTDGDDLGEMGAVITFRQIMLKIQKCTYK